MARRKRSISERLKKCRSQKTRAEMLHEWATEWENEHVDLIDRLRVAIDQNDLVKIKRSFGQLRAVTQKKHDALHNIIDELLSAEE